MNDVQITESIDKSIAEVEGQIAALQAEQARLQELTPQIESLQGQLAKLNEARSILNPVQVNTTKQRKNTKKSTGKKSANRKPRAKLSAEIAAQIRNAEGTQKQIADHFGCSTGMVAAIRQGRAWKVDASSAPTPA